jgi:predicted outer membrane repeat protein
MKTIIQRSAFIPLIMSITTSGGMCNDNSSPTLTNVAFSGNSATSSGGGMYNDNSSGPTLTNVILWGNSGGSIVNIAGNPLFPMACLRRAFVRSAQPAAAA